MSRMNRAVTALVLVVVFLAGMGAASAIDLGGVLKGAAVALLIDRFADDLNNAINRVTGNRNIGTTATTKVVPILSIGQGAFLGGAQVLGPRDRVRVTQAVGQIETSFGNQFRIRILFPMSTRTTRNIDRIEGVGVSALIDVRL